MEAKAGDCEVVGEEDEEKRKGLTIGGDIILDLETLIPTRPGGHSLPPPRRTKESQYTYLISHHSLLHSPSPVCRKRPDPSQRGRCYSCAPYISIRRPTTPRISPARRHTVPPWRRRQRVRITRRRIRLLLPRSPRWRRNNNGGLHVTPNTPPVPLRRQSTEVRSHRRRWKRNTSPRVTRLCPPNQRRRASWDEPWWQSTVR